MAEHGNGGTSPAAFRSSASTRSRASATGMRSDTSGLAAASTALRASEIVKTGRDIGEEDFAAPCVLPILAKGDKRPPMYPGTPRPRRPRPVSDLPLDALLTQLDALTKGWL